MDDLSKLRVESNFDYILIDYLQFHILNISLQHTMLYK